MREVIEEWGCLLWGLLLGACIVAVIVGLNLAGCGGRGQYRNVELVALSDTSSPSGSFFLGSGSIRGELTYMFYYRDGDAIVGGQVSHLMARIYDDSPQTPYARLYTHTWAGDMTPDEFHIPKGSILNQFNLDLKN